MSTRRRGDPRRCRKGSAPRSSHKPHAWLDADGGNAHPDDGARSRRVPGLGSTKRTLTGGSAFIAHLRGGRLELRRILLASVRRYNCAEGHTTILGKNETFDHIARGAMTDDPWFSANRRGGRRRSATSSRPSTRERNECVCRGLMLSTF
jgi:hypothetical protein